MQVEQREAPAHFAAGDEHISRQHTHIGVVFSEQLLYLSVVLGPVFSETAPAPTTELGGGMGYQRQPILTDQAKILIGPFSLSGSAVAEHEIYVGVNVSQALINKAQQPSRSLPSSSGEPSDAKHFSPAVS